MLIMFLMMPLVVIRTDNDNDTDIRNNGHDDDHECVSDNECVSDREYVSDHECVKYSGNDHGNDGDSVNGRQPS